MSEVLDRLESVLADRYVVEREVGRGGMAVVHVVEDVRHYSPFLSWVGRHEEAISQILRARKIDPVDPFTANNVVAHRGLGSDYLLMGRYDEAIRESQPAVDLADGGSRGSTLAGLAYARGGRRPEAEAVLRET